MIVFEIFNLLRIVLCIVVLIKIFQRLMVKSLYTGKIIYKEFPTLNDNNNNISYRVGVAGGQ